MDAQAGHTENMIRSILEYACPMWHTSLTESHSDKLDWLQRRALKKLLPAKSYAEALKSLGLQNSVQAAWESVSCFLHQYGEKRLKVKVEVYNLVPSAKLFSLDFTQLPSGYRSCSFIRHLNCPGSIWPGCHFRRTELFQYTSLDWPIRYPLTPGSRECTCGQSALNRSTTSEHPSAQPGIKPATTSL